MAHADFVHLRVHTAYSLSEGAITIGELVDLCARHDMPAVAITDSGNLFGALEFSMACAEAGIQPIIGTVLGVSSFTKAERKHNQSEVDSLILLVQHEAGYRNLLKLSSQAYLATEDGSVPYVTYAELRDCADGLIALTGGLLGPVDKLLAAHQRPAAEANLRALANMFPGRLYVELQRHGLPEESRVEAALVDLAYEFKLPLVATNDAYYADESMQEAHDALICISDGTYLSQAARRRFTSEHRFKSAQEMRDIFRDLPEAVDNTLIVARRCSFRPLAHEPIFPAYVSARGLDAATEIRQQAEAGLKRRLERIVFPLVDENADRESIAAPYRERLEYELSVIIDMGFAGYFLIVADFIGFARKSGIPVGPGRGSGAGSVAAWSLGITDIDPLRFGLLFERFLNPGRISMPDFDVDFCQEGRDEVLRYVEEKYGRDRVAQIITFGKLQARAALRDVGAGSGNALWSGRPYLQDGSEQSCQSREARGCDQWGAATTRDARFGRGGRPFARDRAEARRSIPACVHTRRGCGHRRPAARRTDPALPRSKVRDAGDTVLHEVRRPGRSGEVRLSWSENTHCIE